MSIIVALVSSFASASLFSIGTFHVFFYMTHDAASVMPAAFAFFIVAVTVFVLSLLTCRDWILEND